MPNKPTRKGKATKPSVMSRPWLPLIEYLTREEKQTGLMELVITDVEREQAADGAANADTSPPANANRWRPRSGPIT